MFYVKNLENQIVLVDEDKQKIINTLEFQPQYKDLPILETAENEVIIDYKLMTLEEADQKAIAERKAQFENDFFKTTLGNIRRDVTMANGETRNFLFDLLPAIKTNVAKGVEVPMFVYREPDFSQEFTPDYMLSLQETKNATQEFVDECDLQISKDFYKTQQAGK